MNQETPSTNSPERHTANYKIGWTVIICTVVLFIGAFVSELINPGKNGFINEMADFAQISGVFIGFAGLFLVLDSLILQRHAIRQQQAAIDQQNVVIQLQKDELKTQNEEAKASNEYFKQQNESLINQQYQTTFFKLIENHSNLVKNLYFNGDNGTHGLKSVSEMIANQLPNYMQSILIRHFNHSYATCLHPLNLIVNSRSSFDSYIRNIRTIIQLVTQHMKGQTLYYEILYNSLTVQEQYCLGVYLKYLKNEDSDYINSCSFNFSQYYNTCEPKLDRSPSCFFPFTQIKRTSRLNDVTYADFMAKSTGFLDFQISFSFDLFEGQINLEKVSIEEIGQNNKLMISDDLEKQTYPNGLIVLLNDRIRNNFNLTRIHQFSVTFHFEYFSEKFSISSNFSLEREHEDGRNKERILILNQN